MTTNVIIIDYGMGNLASVRRAFEECGANTSISEKPSDLSDATHIILPGVGAFGDGMKHLIANNWIEPLRENTLGEKKPFLGICLGMQLLAEKGFESGEVAGLGLIPGEVIRLKSNDPRERIPHIGWNEIYPQNDSLIFEGVTAGTDVYFVHSYHFVPRDKNHVIATTPYCGGFVSAVRDRNIFGVQFHPEKSSKPGFTILRNFLNA